MGLLGPDGEIAGAAADFQDTMAVGEFGRAMMTRLFGFNRVHETLTGRSREAARRDRRRGGSHVDYV
jgi:hypothetical protein